ncbi:hypothetical protein HRI_003903100 [Hibiscus trionum]|uniref:Uncharacterized protein n=1 Tax=Hibiscus trionum TaxID=183268 RepID=A0A9W7IYR1_HIBTR|nr:hypothetical protein HRI_003903100 [Hibiscus trionum]
MAGLLQYNFFPTDFYYPTPPQSLPDAARATAVTIQAPNREIGSSSSDINDLEWPRSLGFRVHRPRNTESARLSSSFHQRQQQRHVEDQTKPVKYYPNPISWLDMSPEHPSGSS